MLRGSLPWPLLNALQRNAPRPARWLLLASIAEQKMRLMERVPGKFQQKGPIPLPPSAGTHRRPIYTIRQTYRISTSAYGVGQEMNSNQTPLGLHQVAARIGGGQPCGTVFRGRQPVGCTWQGLPQATIVHRILRLAGLEPGLNLGGRVDSFDRYIYIHGFWDESTLGRPNSHGCIHMASKDLIPLFDLLPVGSLVWITANRLPPVHYTH